MAVEALSGSNELVGALPLAHVSVVLFTALWSFDSISVLSTLERVASRFPPRELPPHVAFYSVPVLVSELDAPPPPPPPSTTLRAVLFGAPASYRAAFNATRGISFFPALRVFTGSNTGGAEGIPPETYTDSFTDSAMYEFVVRLTRRAIDHVEQSCERGSPSVRSLGRVGTGDSSGGLREGFGPEVTKNAVRLARVALDSIVRRPGDPFELSPDAFTKLVFTRRGREDTTDAVYRGAVVLVRGGAATVRARYLVDWNLLSDAVNRASIPDDRSWALTVIDTSRFGEFAERYGIPETDETPKLLLVDSVIDNAQVMGLPETQEAALRALQSFANSPPGELRVRISQKHRPQVYKSLPDESVHQIYGEAIDEMVSLWLDRKIVWVVVHQPWCGFSQRAMAVAQTFASRSHISRVFATSDVDNLPDDVDKLVDGFPTILRVVADSKASEELLGNTCRPKHVTKCRLSWIGEKGFSYKEYTGHLSVDGMLSEVDGAVSLKPHL